MYIKLCVTKTGMLHSTHMQEN